MEHKAVEEFTEDEKNWMNTIAVNYIIAQSDGFQLGYAQAVNDFTKNIIDYWKNSDDEPQQSVLDTLVDLGEQLGKRKRVAGENIKLVKKEGYDQFEWFFTLNDECFPRRMGLFIKEFTSEAVKEPESARIETESAQVEQESAQAEQENAHTEIVEEPSTKAAEIQSEPEQAETEEDVPRKGFGKWSEYMGKALSTLEQNLIIKGMTEEGYTLSQISVVVRLSQQTICNRKKKIDWTGSEEKQKKE